MAKSRPKPAKPKAPKGPTGDVPTAASKAWTKASRTGLLVAGAVAAAAAAAAATVKVSSNPTAEPANATFANGAEECECALDDWASPPPDAERFEYGPGCDFDVLDALPSQQEFDAKYWHRAPVLIVVLERHPLHLDHRRAAEDDKPPRRPRAVVWRPHRRLEQPVHGGALDRTVDVRARKHRPAGPDAWQERRVWRRCR